MEVGSFGVQAGFRVQDLGFLPFLASLGVTEGRLLWLRGLRKAHGGRSL